MSDESTPPDKGTQTRLKLADLIGKRVELQTNDGTLYARHLSLGDMGDLGPLIDDPAVSDEALGRETVRRLVSRSSTAHNEPLLTGFAAVAALIVANHDKVVATTSPGAARWIIGLFIVAAVLHTVQRIICTIVESGVVGGREGENLKLGEMSLSDMFRLLDAMSAAYPWPFRKLIEASFKKIKAGDLAHVSRIVLRMAIAAALDDAQARSLDQASGATRPEAPGDIEKGLGHSVWQSEISLGLGREPECIDPPRNQQWCKDELSKQAACSLCLVVIDGGVIPKDACSGKKRQRQQAQPAPPLLSLEDTYQHDQDHSSDGEAQAQPQQDAPLIGYLPEIRRKQEDFPCDSDSKSKPRQCQEDQQKPRRDGPRTARRFRRCEDGALRRTVGISLHGLFA
jgi:hypothetical protein